MEVTVSQYLSVSGGGMLRGAAPDKSCVVRSTAARVVIVSVVGARVEKSGVQGREWSSRQDQVRGLVEVVLAGTSTVGGPLRRDVGRAKPQEHFHNNSFNSPLSNPLLTPSTFFQPTPTDFFLSINNNRLLPFNLPTTIDFFLSIYNHLRLLPFDLQQKPRLLPFNLPTTTPFL